MDIENQVNASCVSLTFNACENAEKNAYQGKCQFNTSPLIVMPCTEKNASYIFRTCASLTHVKRNLNFQGMFQGSAAHTSAHMFLQEKNVRIASDGYLKYMIFFNFDAYIPQISDLFFKHLDFSFHFRKIANAKQSPSIPGPQSECIPITASGIVKPETVLSPLVAVTWP